MPLPNMSSYTWGLILHFVLDGSSLKAKMSALPLWMALHACTSLDCLYFIWPTFWQKYFYCDFYLARSFPKFTLVAFSNWRLWVTIGKWNHISCSFCFVLHFVLWNFTSYELFVGQRSILCCHWYFELRMTLMLDHHSTVHWLGLFKNDLDY